MDPAVQFVRVCYGNDFRIVTFYQNQPVNELRTLLGALFPGTTSAHGRRPVAVERLMDGQVVPLSSATKFPEVMSEGNWELLVSRANTLRTEKLVLSGFLQDMFEHGYITPEQTSTLNDLLNASDNYLLDAYREFRTHRDVVQLKNDLLECASTRANAAAAVAATGIDNFFPRMTAFVEHKQRTGQLTETQTDILIHLIESGSAAIISAYHSARERDDPDALFEGMLEIANFYLQSEERDIIEHLQEQQDQQDQQDQYEQYERPTTPTPYGEEDDVDDLIDMYEDLIDSDMIPLQVQDELRNIILSENPYVTAAVELYRATEDVEDFVDTLLRIIEHQRRDDAVTPQEAYDQQQTTWQVEEGEGEEEMDSQEGEEHYAAGEAAGEENISWQAIEGTVRLLDSLMAAKVFDYEQTKRLSMLLLSDYTSTQQEVMVAAFQLYEQDGDIEEFVDTCTRVLRQLSELNLQHMDAYRSVVMTENRFSDYQQALLTTMWNGLEPRIMAAWDVFVYDRNEAELVDTLSRIVSHEFEIEEELEEEVEETKTGTGGTGGIGGGIGGGRSNPSPTRNLAHKRNYSEIAQDSSTNTLEGEDPTTYQEVMEQVIDLMLVEDVLDHDGAVNLRSLVNEGHAVVQAAYDAFSHDEDVDELMDTLLTVVEYGREQHDADNVGELLSFVEHGVAKGRISPEEGADAAWLVESRDPRIMAAYDLYYEEQDVDDLVETIRTTVAIERDDGEMAADREELREDEEEEEEAYTRAVENARSVVRACYHRGELNEDDAVALMEAPDDPRLLAAVDNFAEDGQWDELCDTLRRLGGNLNGTYGYDDRNMDNTVANEAGNDNDNENDNETENNNRDDDIDVDDDDLDEWMQEHADANGYKMSYDTEAGTTDYTDGDMTGDGEEDDDEDFYGLADLRRDVAMENNNAANGAEDDSDGSDSSTDEVDVGDLVLRMNLTAEEKMTVYDLLRADEAMVNAAFEIYEQDGDMQDLNDTLKRVVSRYLRQAEENVEEESVAERVFDALRRNGTISEEEKERFIMFLDGGNVVAEAALEVFGLDGDAQDFIDTMRRID